MFTTELMTSAAVAGFSILWLREMPARWRADLATLRSGPELTDRLVVVIIWGVSFALVAHLGRMLLHLLSWVAR